MPLRLSQNQMNQGYQIRPCDITNAASQYESLSFTQGQNVCKTASSYESNQKHDAESTQRCLSKEESNLADAGKRMLSFALKSAVSHNRRNLAHSAKNKNPYKLTFAEKQALQTVVEKTAKVSVWQNCSDKSDRSWDTYLAKKLYQQRSIKLVDVWQYCSDASDQSWNDYVWSKDCVWKYCSKKKSWTRY